MEPEVGPVLAAIASALARHVEPDLSALPPDQVRQARRVMFGPNGLRPELLDQLRTEVSQDSGGAIALQDADPATFPWLSKEWGARYLRLSGPGIDQLLILGDTEPMVQFATPA